MKRYRITIKGKQYDVQVGDLSSSPVTVNVDGVDYQVDLPGKAGQPAAPASQPARPATPSALPAAPPRPAIPTSGADGSIRALMPGRIVRVNVSVGDIVTANQAVLVMESMKMENTITAPVAGTVLAVLVSEGDTVQHGQTLIEME